MIARQFVETLRPQERRILSKAAEGLTNEAIARSLHYSPRTVEQYLWRASLSLPKTADINPRVALVLAYLEGTGRLV
jgi:DNA-binding NarL/FixJ family response regulator